MGDGGRVPKRQEETKRKLWRPWVGLLTFVLFQFAQIFFNFPEQDFWPLFICPEILHFSWLGLLKACQRQLNFRRLVELCFKFNRQCFLFFQVMLFSLITIRAAKDLLGSLFAVDRHLSIQGSANPQTPGSENKRWKSCVLLPVAGRRTQLFYLIFTEPGVCGFADPCIRALFT